MNKQQAKIEFMSSIKYMEEEQANEYWEAGINFIDAPIEIILKEGISAWNQCQEQILKDFYKDIPIPQTFQEAKVVFLDALKGLNQEEYHAGMWDYVTAEAIRDGIKDHPAVLCRDILQVLAEQQLKQDLIKDLMGILKKIAVTLEIKSADRRN